MKHPRLYISLIISFSLILIVTFIVMFVNRPSKPTDTSFYAQISQNQQLYLSNIIQQRGQPSKQNSWQNLNVSFYPSTDIWDDQIFTDQTELVQLVILQVSQNPTETKTKYQQFYGQSNLTLYGPLSPDNNLYAYPEQGFAYVGKPNDQQLFQLWYFPPISKAEFINSIAQKLSYTTQSPTESDPPDSVEHQPHTYSHDFLLPGQSNE